MGMDALPTSNYISPYCLGGMMKPRQGNRNPSRLIKARG